MSLSAKELKKTMFGGFIKFLDNIGVGDPFSMDVWMSKALDLLQKQYDEEVKINTFLAHMPLTAAEDLVKRKKEQAQKGNGNRGGIVTGPTLVNPEGKPLK